MITFHGKPFVNLWPEHKNKALTVAAVTVFVVCRFFGPPLSYFGFVVLAGWLLSIAYLERSKIAALWDRLTNRKAHRLADEARIEGDSALAAVAMDTPEGDIQAAHQLSAWNEQIGRLEAITAGGGKLDRAQELLKAQLHRDVRRVRAALDQRHATPESIGDTRMGLLGAVGQANPLLSVALNPMTWMAAAAALSAGGFGFQTWRANHLKADNARLEERIIEGDHAFAIEHQHNVALRATVDANQAATRDLNAHLSTIQRRSAEQQRRANDALRQITAGSPPDWGSLLGDTSNSVRHDEPIPEPPPSADH